jgi:hypothetical protein
MISWTLARPNGDERTLEAWGIRSALDRRVSLGTGTVEIGFGRADLLGGLPFDPNETVLIQADGEPYFRGRVVGETRGAYGSSEAASVTLADPWWYLEKIIFCRQITVVASATANPVASDPSGLRIQDFATTRKFASDIILSESDTGTLTDSRAMIVDAVNYAISKGAPIALGTIDDGLQIPREELHDVTCAELILKALRWTPDQASWWDYSVNPPALNVRARAHRDLLSLDVNDGQIQRVDINPRHDLVLSGVTLNYLRRHARTNFEFVTLDADTAGPSPLGIGALVATIELFGSFLSQPATVAGSTPPATIVPQEAAPVGLAASLYNAYKDLSFDGAVRFLAADAGALYLSATLRVLNGAPAWKAATMDIQGVAIDLFALTDADGEYYSVELSVGPPRHLGPTDLVGLVRKGRTKPPPLIGGPNDGGAPRLPVWNYGNPDLPAANAHADVVLFYYHGQDVGFPDSYGGYDGDAVTILDLATMLTSRVRATDLTPGNVSTTFGVRVVRVERYRGRGAPTAGIPAELRNNDFPPNHDIQVSIDADHHVTVTG